MKQFFKFLSYVFLLIAIPGWTIEKIVSIFKPNWKFDQYSATPYFILLNIFSLYLILLNDSFAVVLGIYIITSMELLAILICLSISIGKASNFLFWLNHFAKRNALNIKDKSTYTPGTLYISIISYIYTIFFFGVINYFVYLKDASSFNGIKSKAAVVQMLDFLYYSTVTISTLGYGDITPLNSIPKILVVIEIFCGLFFMIFIFGAYVSYYINKLSVSTK